jgi:hypothetical protein
VHERGIAFEDLPRTFQDFVEFAQSIGIRYIWIDSLCIIQGDSQDWHSEAAKMGNVYRNAALVVAASGAEDSSQGLFVNIRSARIVFRLPYRTGAGVNGTFNMMQLPAYSDWYPAHGPLETRAWTLQERYLAQRFITFMPGGITWSCKTMSVNEAGQTLAGFNRMGEDWFRLLNVYTRRSLTFPSDRTEALRGIAEELAPGSWKDRYIPDYGVWADKLMEQLLWFKNGPCFDNSKLPNKPSWSWTATGSVKAWPFGFAFDYDLPGLNKMLGELVITSEGHLHIFGHLSTAIPAPSYVRDESTARHLRLPEVQQLYHTWSKRPTTSYILTQDIDHGYGQVNLGSACFDNDSITSYSHAFFLRRRKIWSQSTGAQKPFVKHEFIVRIHHLDTMG